MRPGCDGHHGLAQAGSGAATGWTGSTRVGSQATAMSYEPYWRQGQHAAEGTNRPQLRDLRLLREVRGNQGAEMQGQAMQSEALALALKCEGTGMAGDRRKFNAMAVRDEGQQSAGSRVWILFWE